MNAAIDIKHLLTVRTHFRCATDTAPIRDETHYLRMTEMLEALLDETEGTENHSVIGLVDIAGGLIEDLGAEHHPLPEATGAQALKFLTKKHNLKQSDLSETVKRRQITAETDRYSHSCADKLVCPTK